MKSGSFARLATVTASTKRMGAVAATGLSGDLAVSVATLKCTPLYPLTKEVAQLAGIGMMAELLQTFVEGGVDILAGDTFTANTITYRVRAVGEWSWRPTATDTLAIVLAESKEVT